ncbi:Hypothetical predicted protein [Mytilus galloprovincialis]|uniref:Endonuclease/exonuclease/phosphatase domain-containing protein n=1 Tax=Mytilus galloprovincialis TaxID=29158 RepID=A0A8B6GUL4_MYTGA|nr:Hypothetical predicted protein [Mytilus galloprovincialis]
MSVLRLNAWKRNLQRLHMSFTSNLMCGYLNINSIRHKFESIKDLLHRNLVDILFLSETEIDESFPNAQFCVDNFTMWRADRNQQSGGLIAYVRSDLAADRKIQLEFSDVESIGIEAVIGNKKWFFCGIYKPPSMSDDHFSTDCTKTIDKIISKYDNYIFIGDFNYNMLNCDKSAMIREICDIFNLKNIIKKATCFTKIAKATLLDLILMNHDCDFKKICNFGTGISDVHNFISVQLNCDLPKILPKKEDL